MSDLSREKFEARVIALYKPKLELQVRQHLSLVREDGTYDNPQLQWRWEGWKLARSESAPSPTRESLHAEWMAQEKYLDWSNFLLNKLTGEAGSPAPAPTQVVPDDDDQLDFEIRSKRLQAGIKD